MKLPLLLTVIVTTLATTNAERQENAHTACTVGDLALDCPDETVDKFQLASECGSLTGIPAARCFMEYLCEWHDQETVDEHKTCIDIECPLAKHIPALNCDEFLGPVDDQVEVEDAPADTTEVEDDEEEEDPDEENTEEEDPDDTTEEDVGDEAAEQDAPADTADEAGNADQPASFFHRQCTTADLSLDCSPDSVDKEQLEAKCSDESGIPAARCFMEYLCDAHDQASVDEHKICIDKECPLAKHIPALDCSAAPEEVTVLSESTEVTKSPLTSSEQQQEEEVPDGSSGIGGFGIFMILFLFLAVVGGLAMLYKEKLLGTQDETVAFATPNRTMD